MIALRSRRSSSSLSSNMRVVYSMVPMGDPKTSIPWNGNVWSLFQTGGAGEGAFKVWMSGGAGPT